MKKIVSENLVHVLPEPAKPQARHTPGPWKTYGRTVYAGETPVSLAISDFDAELSPVYGNDSRHPLKDDDEAFANARLIASAPELLEALQWCVTVMRNQDLQATRPGTNLDAWLNQADSAIASATEGADK